MIISFACTVALLLPFVPAHAQTDTTPTRKPPSGNFCGPDDKNPNGNQGRDIKYFKPEKEISSPPSRFLTPNLFDKYTFQREARACWVPTTIESYYNSLSVPVNYKFTSKATRSTTFDVGVSANFHEAFSASMGYSAQNTVEKSSEFSVSVKPHTGVKLEASPSVMVITGKWSYLTGSQQVQAYYPTHITWLTSRK